ncbi:hypothetical protein JCM5350_001199 [Sporobolomyces pararoseus]
MELDILAAWQTSTRDLTRSTTNSSSFDRINQLSQAWSIAVDYLDASKLLKGEEAPPSRQVIESIQLLNKSGMMDQLLNEYLDSIKKSFHLIQSEIVSHLDRYQVVEGQAQFQQMLALLDSIGNSIKTLQQPLNPFNASTSTSSSANSLNLFRKTFLSNLYYHLSQSPIFSTCLQSFLKVLLTLPNPTTSSTEYPLAFPTLITLLDRYDPLLFSLIYEQIEFKTLETCKNHFREEKQLQTLLKWLNGTNGKDGSGVGGGGGGVLGWVTGIYDSSSSQEGGGGTGTEEAKKFLKPTFSRFEYHIHKVLCQLRTTELFDMILDFPESKPALEDLRLCLIKTDQRSLLISRLRQQLSSRLLHPGIDTREIIKVYVSTIRCLRIIDPPGVLLSRIIGLVKNYLRGRKDTIRCIVSSLIQEGNPLFEELKQPLLPEGNGKVVSSSSSSSSSSSLLVSDSNGQDAENFTDQKWLPDPVDAPIDFKKSKSADVLQLLVSIYDSKEVFIKELQVLLAQRLLEIKDYKFEKEIENVQVLKSRFGEQSLQGLEVMLKDLKDSQKIDQLVHHQSQQSEQTTGDRGGSLPLHSTIVSRLFWPSFQNSSTSSSNTSKLKLPGQLGKIQSKYDELFTTLKPDKKLKWLPQLGNLDLTIEMKDGRILNVDSTTPVQAAVLELFDKQDTWTIESLESELRLSSASDLSLVRNALYFWSNLGIVKSLSTGPGGGGGGGGGGDEQWQLVEEQTKEGAKETEHIAHVVEEEKQAVQSVEEQNVAQMRVFWQYIQGMLTNLGTLPLGRIHSTLNMLAPGYKGKTTDELKALLEAVESEGLVRKLPSGSYKIVK